MKDIIYDILISASIMSLLITSVIPVFKSNAGLIHGLAVQEGCDEVSGSFYPDLSTDMTVIIGCELISSIRYYENGNVPIRVSLFEGTVYVYNGETYDPDIFKIPYDSNFQCIYTYEGTILTYMEFVEIEI